VVHRDFTPDNLILNNDGVLKLVDFNVAQQKDVTATGTVVGKHAYLPPEQFRGHPGTRSDIYALGATLYYLLTGEEPEPISVSRPRAVVGQVSQELDDIVARATAPNETDRYGTVQELEADLFGKLSV
jgi:serine/threonine protein kinase